MHIFKDENFRRFRDLERSEVLADLTIVCKVKILPPPDVDHIHTDDQLLLLLLGWSRIRPAGSTEPSQQLSQKPLLIFLSAEGCQHDGGAGTSHQVKGTILNWGLGNSQFSLQYFHV